MTKKTQPSEVIRSIQGLFNEFKVRPYYKHAIKRVFIEGSDLTHLELAKTYSDLRDWEPTEIRTVNGFYSYFSVPVQQIPHGTGEDSA